MLQDNLFVPLNLNRDDSTEPLIGTSLVLGPRDCLYMGGPNLLRPDDTESWRNYLHFIAMRPRDSFLDTHCRDEEVAQRSQACI